MNKQIRLFQFCAALAVAAFVTVAGCSSPKPEPAKPAADTAKNSQGMTAPPAAPGLDVGDVEAGVLISATVPPEMITDQVSVDNMETARKRLAMATITVRPPYPDKLVVRVTVAPQVSFEKQPVVIRGGMLRDEKPIDPELTALVTKGGPSGEVTAKFDVDVMQGLVAPPDSMLVYAKLDAYLMPVNTPVMTIDPKTATSELHTELRSNPVRINFAK